METIALNFPKKPENYAIRLDLLHVKFLNTPLASSFSLVMPVIGGCDIFLMDLARGHLHP
jgi:hypothetical protein